MDTSDNITEEEERTRLRGDNSQNQVMEIQDSLSPLEHQVMLTDQNEIDNSNLQVVIESGNDIAECDTTMIDSIQTALDPNQDRLESTSTYTHMLDMFTQQSQFLGGNDISEGAGGIEQLLPGTPVKENESLALISHDEHDDASSSSKLEFDPLLKLGATDIDGGDSINISNATGDSQGEHFDVSARSLEGTIAGSDRLNFFNDDTIVSNRNLGESVECLTSQDENVINLNICSDSNKSSQESSYISQVGSGFYDVSADLIQEVNSTLQQEADMCISSSKDGCLIEDTSTNEPFEIENKNADEKEKDQIKENQSKMKDQELISDSTKENIESCMQDRLQPKMTDSASFTEETGDQKPKQSKLLPEDNIKSNFLTTCELKETEEENRGPALHHASKESLKSEEDKKKKKVEDKADEEPEFVWERHLQDTGSYAVPATTFKHVESSLESGFVKGMKLEVPNKCNKDTYWVASVLMTCGPLLRLRFDGYEDDSTADFWCDLMTSEIHPIGWCAQNNQILQPPEAIKDKFDDWRDFLVKSLTGARTAPAYLLDKTTGITPVDQLKQGMRLELQHPINPVEVWLVKILENVGGRLYLRFEGLETATHDFWLFYLNHRLHPIGWAKTNGLKYQPPKELTGENAEVDWTDVLKMSMKEAEKSVLPVAVFKDQEEITDHSFKVGMKLEALNPINKTQICPATVVKVLNSQYFVIEIDDLVNTEPEYKIRFSCHSGSKCIFPAKWCHYKGGVSVTPPKGWPKPKLSWIDYLEHCSAEAAPESCFIQKTYDYEFVQGMKFEAVNPENPNQICVATISKVVEPLLWIHLDNSRLYGSSHIEHFESQNLFPVGWCESNGYQLRLPVIAKKTAVVLPEIYDATSEAYHSNKDGEWCPKVYYNHQCFSGPHLSKGRIASLPKCVGPGPINLVMREVLSMLINVAYKPCRVLKELQLEGRPSPDMHHQTLKAKYKGKSYRAIVEICKHADNLREFCRNVCLKLECCTNLISPTYINNECPEKCSLLTKTQYTYYNPKRKVGRPPGGHTNLENGPKKPGKKKKKRRINILSQKGANGEENGSVGDGEEDKESVSSETKTVDSNDNGTSEKPTKRKYVHQVPLPSDIKTRGAKLPKYSFERKTHKKIPIQEKQLQKPHRKSHIREEKLTSPYHISPVKTAMKLSSNPLHWSVQEVVRFIKGTDCAPVARVFKEQEIDGQALLLLNLPTVQEYLDLKLGPAIKLCHHVEKIKVAFFQQYAH